MRMFLKFLLFLGGLFPYQMYASAAKKDKEPVVQKSGPSIAPACPDWEELDRIASARRFFESLDKETIIPALSLVLQKIPLTIKNIETFAFMNKPWHLNRAIIEKTRTDNLNAWDPAKNSGDRKVTAERMTELTNQAATIWLESADKKAQEEAQEAEKRIKWGEYIASLPSPKG